jgi:hypothetical protein
MPKRALESSGSSASDQPTCTIAIDFGTAGTGYAYSFSGSDDIESKEPGGQEARKTLTNLLLDDNGDFKSFGFRARRDYFENETGAFFANYKMVLNESSTGGPQVKALNGTSWPLLDIVTKTLNYVKTEALKEAGRSLPYGLQAKDVQWVLTVPAIWKDGAKGFMRKAAHRAGLIQEEGSRRLVLALEPESACVACDVHKLAKPGDPFMVLDCGGGTVDITMNTLRSASPLRLDEISAPSGGPWGSTYVDKQFERFVEDLIGTHNWVPYKRTSFWIDLLEAWEDIKTSYDPSENASRSLNMSSVLEVIDAMKLNDLVDAYNSRRGAALKLRGKSTVVLSGDMVHSLFEPVITSITDHVSKLTASKPVKYIFLVGGFAESPLLQQKVKQTFETGDCRVIVPVRPGVSVMRGAVIFGRNQDVFATRIARFSYGWSTSRQREKATPEQLRRGRTYMVSRDGGEVPYVDYCFTEAVKVGEKLEADKAVVKRGRRPIHEDQTSIKFKLCTTPRGDVALTTDPSCTSIGTVKIPCTYDESVTMKLNFGATELIATAINEDTNETVEARIEYNN